MCKLASVYCAPNLRIFRKLSIFGNALRIFGYVKSFDRVWHECLIYKLKKIDFSNNLLTLFQSFSDNRDRRVLLNGQNSYWELIKAGVPQVFVLDHCF